MDYLMNVEEIMRLLPHRIPFLMVDRIVEIDQDQSKIVGIKNVTVNEWFFQGHFPSQKVMPGVLLIEAMAQTGAVLLMTKIEDPQDKLIYFMTIDKAKFRKPVVPGDRLKLEVTQVGGRANYFKMRGETFVDGQLVAETDMTCAIIERAQQ